MNVKVKAQDEISKIVKRFVFLLVAALGSPVMFAVAEHDGYRDRDVKRDVAEIVLSEVRFGDHDRRILDEYLRAELDQHPQKKHKKLPPGLRKKLARGGELPPGWQKKLERGEVIDEDIYRYSTNLPEQILRQLSTAPRGTSIRRVEDRIVRIMDATHTILDVLSPGAGHY